MGRVAREMVEKSGINVDELLKKLVAAASAEFTTFYYYTILRVNAIGLEGKPIKDLLTVLVEAERCAIRTYTDLCNFTFGKDHRTYELALAILNEEIEHEAWFSEFLNEGPSGHFQSGAPGASPYVSRYLTAETGRANH